MTQDESLYPQDWFSIGEKDLKRAENLLELHDPEGAGFFIQQSLEKYLKGYLLSEGWKLRRIHSLEILLNDAVIYDPSLEEFRRDCLKITYYYVLDRYPFTMASELSENEINKSLQIAKTLIQKIRTLMLTENKKGKQEKP